MTSTDIKREERIRHEHGQRCRKLDEIRGLAVINMIAYHFLWDLVYIYGFDLGWYRSNGAYLWQQAICRTFIFLSGFCLPLGHNTARRGLTVFAGGALVTAVTLAVMPDSRVIFGVLTLTGSCMLLLCRAGHALRRLPPALGLVVSLLLFGVTRGINDGWAGFEGLRVVKLPEALYRNLLTAYIGFPYKGFYSTDYFSLFPWLFLFLAGCFLFYLMEQTGTLRLLVKGRVPFLAAIGRHSLIIYLLHQPVIYLVCQLALVFCGE